MSLWTGHSSGDWSQPNSMDYHNSRRHRPIWAICFRSGDTYPIGTSLMISKRSEVGVINKVGKSFSVLWSMNWWYCRHNVLFLTCLFVIFRLRSLINTRNCLSVSSARINFAPPVSWSMSDVHGSWQQSNARRGLIMSSLYSIHFASCAVYLLEEIYFRFHSHEPCPQFVPPKLSTRHCFLQLLSCCVHCIETWDCHASTLL
jgi:hypothetical protein